MKRALASLALMFAAPLSMAVHCGPTDPCPVLPLASGESVSITFVRDTPGGAADWGIGDAIQSCGAVDGLGLGDTVAFTTGAPVTECGLAIVQQDVVTGTEMQRIIVLASTADIAGRFNVDFGDGCSGTWELGFQVRPGRDAFGADVDGVPPVRAIRAFRPASGARCEARIGASVLTSCGDYWDARLVR